MNSALPHGQNATKEVRFPIRRMRWGNKELHHLENTTMIPLSPFAPIPPLQSQGENDGVHNATATSSNSSVPIFPVKGRAVEHHGRHNITVPPKTKFWA